MCGIWFCSHANVDMQHAEVQKHRGPDNTQELKVGSNVFVFHRLSINDTSNSGNQPIQVRNTTVMCNGEIYNYKELREVYGKDEYMSGSDCEVIAHMLNETNVEDTCKQLDGDFAFVALLDNERIIAARDPVGVRPLFYGYAENGGIAFSSEAKGLMNVCNKVEEFPPGKCYDNGEFKTYTDVIAERSHSVFSKSTLNGVMTAAVEKRMSADREIGYFLSGGLDSSLIASIGARLSSTPIKTFSIGIGESPDLENARKVAKYIGSNHTEVRFTQEEGVKALRDVIWALESYDCTTVRASVPMYLLCKYVTEKTNVKVVLSGEGADELFGGYLYLHNAPNAEEFQKESVRLLKNVHTHDVTRADRCSASNGLELRVPFFDKELMKYVIEIHPVLKMPTKKRIEKHILRASFETSYLPKEVLWRQKDGMSDAVGYTWVDGLRKAANEKYTDAEFETWRLAHKKNSPKSKEELWYRTIYTELFGKIDNVANIWRPKWTDHTDPSAAMLKVHANARED